MGFLFKLRLIFDSNFMFKVFILGVVSYEIKS